MTAEVSRNPRPLVLIGDPVAQSLSPLIHNTALRAIGEPATYVACRVELGDLERAVAGLRALGFLGANVTIPHKETVLPLVDRLTDSASAVGAVNTLHFDRDAGVLLGDNTDVDGFCAPLVDLADRLEGRDVLILGSGGAARAVAFALSHRFQPGRVRIAARNRERAARLSAEFELSGTVQWPLDARATQAEDVLINTTPLGSSAMSEESPVPDARGFRAEQLVYDLVYSPRQTRFLRDGQAAGALCIGGLPMLIGQAAAAFRRWKGIEMPMDAVENALAAALAVQ